MKGVTARIWLIRKRETLSERYRWNVILFSLNSGRSHLFTACFWAGRGLQQLCGDTTSNKTRVSSGPSGFVVCPSSTGGQQNTVPFKTSWLCTTNVEGFEVEVAFSDTWLTLCEPEETLLIIQDFPKLKKVPRKPFSISIVLVSNEYSSKFREKF